MTGRRRIPAWLLVLAFVCVPLLEIYVLIQVGQVIGPWWTILLLVVSGVVGTWLIKREGARAWAALRTALAAGRMPAREIADGALILAGGILMLSPGFVTDLLGIALILPVTRPIARGALTRVVSHRLVVAGPVSQQRPRPGPGGDVVEGEVID